MSYKNNIIKEEEVDEVPFIKEYIFDNDKEGEHIFESEDIFQIENESMYYDSDDKDGNGRRLAKLYYKKKKRNNF